MASSVEMYIRENWDCTIRYNPQDQDTLIGLPLPYTCPCCDGMYTEMYYWDTYFTNVGLIHSGRLRQARNNVDNMCYLIQKYGFMPNGNRTYYLSRSQPPFLSQMVRQVYEIEKDTSWLARCYDALETEYRFWQAQRLTDSGLNRYFGSFTDEKLLAFGKMLCGRFHIPCPEDLDLLRRYGMSMYAFAESGWDCNSRFGLDAYAYNPVDLNALLYGMEENMAWFSRQLQNGREDFWHQAAGKRQEIMNALTWDEALGTFCDYNFQTRQPSAFLSAAMFYPLFTGLATSRQAGRIHALLAVLEQEFGIACCQSLDDAQGLQWDYPNGWACLQYIVIHGLLRYGYREDALRLAQKYITLVDDIFAKTNNLWEKYDVLTGEVSTAKEYDTPPMMGWSAGVYLDCQKLLEEPPSQKTKAAGKCWFS